MILQIKVEPKEEGFVIEVMSEKRCQGLLVFILEAIEELGLEVLEARVSCVDNFSLEAVGNKVIAKHIKLLTYDTYIQLQLQLYVMLLQRPIKPSNCNLELSNDFFSRNHLSLKHIFKVSLTQVILYIVAGEE